MDFLSSHAEFFHFWLHRHYLFFLIKWETRFSLISLLKVCYILCWNIVCVRSLCTKRCEFTILNGLLLLSLSFFIIVIITDFRSSISRWGLSLAATASDAPHKIRKGLTRNHSLVNGDKTCNFKSVVHKSWLRRCEMLPLHTEF